MAYGSEWAFFASGWFWLLIIWSAIWKGISLWRSARNKHLTWFVFLFIINSAGILPIIYLLLFPKKKPVVAKKAPVRKKVRRKTTKKKTTRKRK